MPAESEPYDIDDVVVCETPCLTQLTRGSIDKGSTQLTVEDASGYAANDVVLVDRAGVLNSALEATVQAKAGNVLTLSVAAGETVTRARVGKLTNPTTSTLTIEKPSGAQVTPAVTSPRTGWLRATHTIDESGDHHGRWRTTGAAAAAEEFRFAVNDRQVA